MKPNVIVRALIIMTAMQHLSVSAKAAAFGDDVAFLKKHTDLVILSDEEGRAQIAVSTAWQGRVLTTTAGGSAGHSFGWINREFIASEKLVPHMNAFGGEDRFWLGPEGGQFSIFFAPGKKFVFEDWQTPAVFDSLPFKLVGQSATEAKFAAQFALTNYSGTHFDIAVDRIVRLLNATVAWEKLGVKPAADVSLVAFESDNKITNQGRNPWKKKTGLLSIWILGMFNPSPSGTIVVPIKAGPEAKLGVKVTSDYFGSIPSERLVVKGDVIFLSADGKFRSKIGINPRRSKAVLGSYDADNQVLTLVQFDQPTDATDYVNSLWKLQEHPYGGDAANAYNDGPPTPGAKPMGPFYELESSSPAAALSPGKSLSHLHRTFHLSGSEATLDSVAQATLGVSLSTIKTAIPKP